MPMLLNFVGNCAISVSAQEQEQSTTWDMVRVVAEHLVGLCVSSPIHKRAGGTAISQPKTSKSKRQSSTQDSGNNSLPLSLQISVYYQPTFLGPADDTCAWEVVSNHSGNVHQCPSVSAPPSTEQATSSLPTSAVIPKDLLLSASISNPEFLYYATADIEIPTTFVTTQPFVFTVAAKISKPEATSVSKP